MKELDHESECPLCNDDLRIEKLTALFQDLVKYEGRISPSKYEDASPYQAMYFIEDIQPQGVFLEADNGHRVGPMRITPEIRELLFPSDIIVMTAGLIRGVWRMTSFDWMMPGERVEIDLNDPDEDDLTDLH